MDVERLELAWRSGSPECQDMVKRSRIGLKCSASTSIYLDQPSAASISDLSISLHLCILACGLRLVDLSDLSTSDLRPLNVQPPRRLDLQPSPSVSSTTPFSLGISIRASTISSRRLSISSSLVLSSSSGSFADLSVSS